MDEVLAPIIGKGYALHTRWAPNCQSLYVNTIERERVGGGGGRGERDEERTYAKRSFWKWRYPNMWNVWTGTSSVSRLSKFRRVKTPAGGSNGGVESWLWWWRAYLGRSRLWPTGPDRPGWPPRIPSQPPLLPTPWRASGTPWSIVAEPHIFPLSILKTQKKIFNTWMNFNIRIRMYVCTHDFMPTTTQKCTHVYGTCVQIYLCCM